MLKNNLKDISNIVLLRSDKILNELLHANSYDNLSQKNKSYEHGVRDFYPNAFRKGAIENSMQHTLSQSNSKDFTLDYKFDFLDGLFDYYLKLDGNHIYAKKEILSSYSSLINKIHPFNIIGYKLAKLYNSNKLPLQNIKDYAKYITPLGLNTNREFKEYADNHIHLGGSNSEALNFVALLSNPTNEIFYTDKVFDTLPRINEFSYINNGNISLGNLINIMKYCVSIINTAAEGKQHRKNIKEDLKSLAKYGRLAMIDVDFASFDMIEKFSSKYNSLTVKNELLKEVIEYKKGGYTNKLWFIYNILLFDLHLTEKNDRDLQRVIKVFLHATNILRSYMVMSQNIGLSHFSEFFGSTMRKQEQNRFQNVASNIISNGTTKVEAKIAPDAVINDEMTRYKLAFDKEIIKRESSNARQTHQKYFLDTNISERNYHFCVHFVREVEKTKNTQSGIRLYRFYYLRVKLKKQAIKLNNFLYKESKIVSKFDFYRKFYADKIEVLKNEKYLADKYIDLSKLITTIDVAGDENRTPPEVFAPIIKYLRRDIKKLDDFRDNYIKYQRDGHDFIENYKLRLSVHAGEDFNHIVTGMRKVHETVKFYHMNDRDRLGHALAIGLNPKKWCELNGDIFVTKHEHFDNLVWLYHQANEIDGYFQFTDRLKSKYEKVALELFKDIYGNFEATIDDMYKAWKLREYCPVVMFNDNDFAKRDEYIEPNLFDAEKYPYYDVAKKIYKKYHTCESVRNNGDKVMKIEYDNINIDGYHKYFITDDDLDLIEAVQDRLIQKFCDKGIIIETNPSSNVYIAHINSYYEHPIYRWNPIEDDDLKPKDGKFNRYGIRSSRMKVCVNTDDPAIMPTTLRNEFKLIERNALASHSSSQEKIEQWSENIRKTGIEIFDYDHQKSEFRRV